MTITRLWHAVHGHPLDQVQHFPKQATAWCRGCRKWLDPGTSGRLFAQRAIKVHEERQVSGPVEVDPADLPVEVEIEVGSAEQRWTVAEEIASRYFEPKDDDWNFLRIDVAGALAGEFEELPKRAEPVDTEARRRELRSQLYEWLGSRTSRASGDPHGHESLRKLADELATLIEGIR